jgi:hypothetical protein
MTTGRINQVAIITTVSPERETGDESTRQRLTATDARRRTQLGTRLARHTSAPNRDQRARTVLLDGAAQPAWVENTSASHSRRSNARLDRHFACSSRPDCRAEHLRTVKLVRTLHALDKTRPYRTRSSAAGRKTARDWQLTSLATGQPNTRLASFVRLGVPD